MRREKTNLWLIVGNLLQQLALGRWRQAAVWARSLVRHLAARGDER